MDNIDKHILEVIQHEIPLVSRPFKFIAEQLNVSAPEIIERIARLKQQSIIRTISGIFNPHKLGFNTILIALHVPEENVDLIAEKINSWSSVSHNYKRDHFYNLWFTCVYIDQNSFEDTINKFCQDNKIEHVLLLSAEKVFKSRVIFKFNKENNVYQLNSPVNNEKQENIVVDKDIIRQLQKELSLIPEPFKVLADEINMSEEVFLYAANEYLRFEVLKRYCATLRHYRAGYTANAMVVWNIEPPKINYTGELFATYDFVSHCYQRKNYNEWPYNLYTMIHAHNMPELLESIEILNQAAGPNDYQTLHSIKEYKKARVKYYL